MMLGIILILSVKTSFALIGFDCGGQHLNITAVSLLDVGECNLHHQNPNSTETYIQLLQLSEYNYAEVIQCKVEISRTIYYCGMHSHISVVFNGKADYVQETGYSQCLRMFQDGTTSLGPAHLISGLKINQTSYHSLTLAGELNTDGTCKGTQYSDPYGTWDNVIVQAVAKISLKSSYVPVQLEHGKIKLRSGTICTLADSFCLDSDDGYTFWKPVPTKSCNFNQYDVLYEGLATKITGDDSPVIYSLTTQDITFALTKTKEQPLCGYTLLRTEHPKLFILETKQGQTFANKGTIPVDNLDIFTYMNSKFVYVEKHIRHQMTSLYHNVMQQKCELERQVMTNALSFATLLPDEFAYSLMKSPGYMAVTTGEAVQIIKCIPVEVTVRPTKECYNELPVTVRNNSYFLTPKSRIVTKIGNERECSHELPTLYRIEDTWVQFAPKAQVRQLPPQQLRPMASLTWSYLTPGPLAVSGIYTQQDIEKLRDHIMFPAEKPALLNAVARGLTGHPVNADSVSLYKLLDEDSLNKIVDNTAARIWRGFMSFGSATAGVVGVFMIVRIVKLAIDTIIHGYALHTVYGCSLHLIGALWDSLTNLLLHLSRKIVDEEKEKNKFPEDITPTTTTSDVLPALPKEPPVISQPQCQNHNIRRPGEMESTNITIPQTYNDLHQHLYNLEQNPRSTSGFILK